MKQADDDRITLEAAVAAVRDDEAPQPVAAAAAARAWERIAEGIPAGAAIRGCGYPGAAGYREGTLPQAGPCSSRTTSGVRDLPIRDASADLAGWPPRGA